MRDETNRRYRPAGPNRADRAERAQPPMGRWSWLGRRARRSLLTAVVLVLGLPLFVFAQYDFGAGTQSDAQPLPAPTVTPAGWRWETWRNVTVQVPANWDRRGTSGAWCATNHPGQPYVARPDGGSRAVGCGRRTAQNMRASLLFYPAAAAPDGSLRMPGGFRRTTVHIGDVALAVTTDDPALRAHIIDSAHQVHGTDPNGCRAGLRIPRLGRAPSAGRAATSLAGVSSASVCRYRPGSLDYSYRVDAAAARRLLTAVLAARSGPSPDARADCRGGLRRDGQAGLLRFHARNGVADVWVHYDDCARHGTDDGTTVRHLSTALLAPLLSVGWAGVLDSTVPWNGQPHRP